MNLLFDTNILLAIIRSKDSDGIIEFLNPKNKAMYVSVASEAEIKTIARKANWGVSRVEKYSGCCYYC